MNIRTAPVYNAMASKCAIFTIMFSCRFTTSQSSTAG